ncbi:hypothetical protein Droror1_Dr00022163 [Drosera rotundifolia]
MLMGFFASFWIPASYDNNGYLGGSSSSTGKRAREAGGDSGQKSNFMANLVLYSWKNCRFCAVYLSVFFGYEWAWRGKLRCELFLITVIAWDFDGFGFDLIDLE